MTPFAFIIHPIHARDASRKYPFMKFLPEGVIERLMTKLKPGVASHITGVTSLTGQKTEGWFIGLPMTPRMMLANPELSLEKLQVCTELAQAEGARLIGLGAFTAIVGDGGVSLSKLTSLGVTTGNSYTVATAIEGALDAAERVGIVPEESCLGVVGATGSIGQTCARVLAPQFACTLLIGRDLARTEAAGAGLPRCESTTDVARLTDCDLVITVTSSDNAIIEPRHLKSGSVVCDVSRPRDVSIRVVRERPDVLVIEGGVIDVPGPVEFGIDFGFPPRTAYACMSETMLLALEGRTDHYTLGKNVTVEQVEETVSWAAKHGFKLAGYRAFEKAVGEAEIARVRTAREKRLASGRV